MRGYTNQLLTTEEIQKLACPKCGAKPGEPCQGTRGSASHIDRMRLARAQKAKVRRA